MAVDLHLHTTASDGSASPEEVVERAASLGLRAIAISDHDTTAGIEPALASGKRLGIEVIPAVELSSKYDSRDMHILGYFIDPNDPSLLTYLEILREARAERAEKIVACLNQQGIAISFDEVRDLAGTASIGRPHIAKVLLAKGHVASMREAFIEYLRRGAQCFIEKFVYPPDKLIDLVHDAGGVAVWAHPGLADLDVYLPEFVRFGLDGIEAYHADHTPEMIQRYKMLADIYDVVVTGGSDSHGPLSPHGERMGIPDVPDEALESLRARWEQRRKA